MNFLHFRDPDPRDLIGRVGADGRDILGPENAAGAPIRSALLSSPREARDEHPFDSECLNGWLCRVTLSEEMIVGERRLVEREEAAKREAVKRRAELTGSEVRALGVEISELRANIDLNPMGRAKRKADRAVRLARLERELIDAQERHEHAAKALKVER